MSEDQPVTSNEADSYTVDTTAREIRIQRLIDVTLAQLLKQADSPTTKAAWLAQSLDFLKWVKATPTVAPRASREGPVTISTKNAPKVSTGAQLDGEGFQQYKFRDYSREPNEYEQEGETHNDSSESQPITDLEKPF